MDTHGPTRRTTDTDHAPMTASNEQHSVQLDQLRTYLTHMFESDSVWTTQICAIADTLAAAVERADRHGCDGLTAALGGLTFALEQQQIGNECAPGDDSAVRNEARSVLAVLDGLLAEAAVARTDADPARPAEDAGPPIRFRRVTVVDDGPAPEAEHAGADAHTGSADGTMDDHAPAPFDEAPDAQGDALPETRIDPGAGADEARDPTDATDLSDAPDAPEVVDAVDVVDVVDEVQEADATGFDEHDAEDDAVEHDAEDNASCGETGDEPGDAADPVEDLDPTEPVDPASWGLDPNRALDPTGGGQLDPNMALDPTGGGLDPAADLPGGSADESWGSQPILIDEDRAELLQFMVTDVRSSAAEIEPIVAEVYEFTSRQDAADRLVRLAIDMAKVSEFFNFRSFETILSLLRDVGGGLGLAGDAQLGELCLRVRAIGCLPDQYCSGLEVGMELSWPLATMRRRVELLLAGERLHPELVAWHRGDPERVLELDGVTEGVEPLPAPPSEVDDGSAPAAAMVHAEAKPAERAAASIRVTQASVDALFDIVRQLVLNKNQIEGIAASGQPGGLGRAEVELLSLRAAELSRLVKQLQETLNRTSVQPISIVLDRYQRMIHDVAQLKDKQVEFRVTGAEIELDKFALDAIADPLGRLLRDVVSNAIEPVAERAAAGKPARGLMRVDTENHESHITISIAHDGRPRDAEQIRREAAGCEGAPPDLDAMPGAAVRLLPLSAWFDSSETAGVMDTLTEQRASVSLHERDGMETITITLPIVGAVIGVMNVRVGEGTYAVPVTTIREIVNLASHPIQTVGGRPVLRIREMIYPVTRCGEHFGEPVDADPRFAIIVNADGRAAALGVDDVLGHQEIVIEPMGLREDQIGPFLGAAIRGNGRVCLVIDVRRLTAGLQAADARACAA